MCRPTLAALVLATSLTCLTSLSPATAAPGAPDWHAAACSNGGMTEDAPSGPSTLVASDQVPVDGLRGVRVGVDRLDFSGVLCEVLYVEGTLPRGARVSVTQNSWCAAFDYAIDGTSHGDSSRCSGQAGPSRLFAGGGGYDVPKDVHLLTVETFEAQEVEVMGDEHEPGMPPELVGATFTADHFGSSWSVQLAGRTFVRRAFERSAATDEQAQAAYAVQVARAEREHDRRVARIGASDRSAGWKQHRTEQSAGIRREAVSLARKRLRLALDGFRLVERKVRATHSGTLPAA